MEHLKSELFKYLEVLTLSGNFRYQQLLQTSDVLSESQYLVTSMEINALNSGQYCLAKQALFSKEKPYMNSEFTSTEGKCVTSTT